MMKIYPKISYRIKKKMNKTNCFSKAHLDRFPKVQSLKMTNKTLRRLRKDVSKAIKIFYCLKFKVGVNRTLRTFDLRAHSAAKW